MTLLRLSPDGERLRRVAKAHAAGELSTPDYRRIRSDVIESFMQGGAGDVTGDDTQQRWIERPAPLPTMAELESDSPIGALEVRAPRPARAKLLWSAAGIVILAIVIAGVIA